MKKRYPFLPKTWLRVGLATAFAASFSFQLHAQTAPPKRWDRTIGGDGTDELAAILQTSDGSYLLGGTSRSGISGDKTEAQKGGVITYPTGTYVDPDYWVVKLDVNGHKLWDKTIGGTNVEKFTCMDSLAGGGFILGGTSKSGISADKTGPNYGDEDYWIVKLDASGNKLWDKTFGGSGADILTSIKQTADGGYILGGHSNSIISGNKPLASYGLKDYWIVKLDGNGNKLWEKSLGGLHDETLSGLFQTPDKGYLIAGTSDSNPGGNRTAANRGTNCANATGATCFNFWLVKLDSTGNIVWDKAYTGPTHAFLRTISRSSDGGYLLGGASGEIGNDKSMPHCPGYGDDYWILKIDAAGIKQWDKNFCGNHHDAILSTVQTPDGGYLLGGDSYSTAGYDKSERGYAPVAFDSPDYWIVKTDAAGNKLWDKTLGTYVADHLSAVIPSSDGGYIMAGYSGSFTAHGDKSQNSKGGNDYWIVKLGGTLTGIKETEAGLAVSVFPNPSNGKFKLQLSNLPFKTVEITVSDLLGRVVLQKELPVTNNQLFEEINLPNVRGIYLLRLKAGEQTFTRKIAVE